MKSSGVLWLGLSSFLLLPTQPIRAEWIPNGVLASNTTNYMMNPVIAADGFGGAIIAWAENPWGVEIDGVMCA